VLGHELGHIEARHSARQYSKIQLANLAIGVGSVLSEEFNRYSFLVSVGTTLMFLKFSREDERQADRLGVQYSSMCGYDATRMSDFFVTLERLSPSGGSLPEWASTHPDPGDRVRATRQMAFDYQKANPNIRYSTRREEFLELVDGLAFGDDPRQGYVKNGFFYHPDLKFMFPVPSGWTLTNQPSEVLMIPKQQKQTALVCRFAKGTNLLDTSTKFASANSITLTDTKQIEVNGMKGLAALGQIVSEGQTVSVVSNFIQMDEQIMAFHGLAPAGGFGTFEPFFTKTAMGLRRLTDKSLIGVSPDRIAVRAVQRAGTLKDAFQSFGLPADKLDGLAVLNGMNLNDAVKAGIKIKVVG
jgi:predicted Zn-dependent protease